MKKWKEWLIVLGLAAAMAGCSGVVLNAQYSQLLDRTAALSAETARRADANALTGDQMKQALDAQAGAWAKFRDARDGNGN